MGADVRFRLVLACFLLSGFAALLFQTVWTREFAFVFGTSDLAVATVLASYMGGLAAGAAAASRLAPRLRRPVLVYGVLELGIGVSALLVPFMIRASRALSVALFGGRDVLPAEGALGLALFYLACSFGILLVPTALMGATLPLLARDAVRRDSEIGARVGALYATNTLGAVLGALAAGFVLLPWLGLRHTVWAGALVNGLVFALAAAVSRRGDDAVPGAVAAAERDRGAAGAGPTADPLPRAALVLPVMLVSGVASFTYEVLWTRLLGHIFGGSVYAFATMLASFLVGIALGSAVAARFARTPSQAVRGLAGAQLVTALTALLAFFAMDALPEILRALGGKGMQTPLRNAFLGACVLVPSTLAIGATFPFAVRMLARGEASAASARVYAWNTMGAIVGAVGAGFFVVPALGYAGSLVAAVALNLLLVLALAFVARGEGGLRPLAAAASVLLVLLGFARLEEPWKLLSSAPIGAREGGVVSYFGVGRSATVLLVESVGNWSLRTNGLPEAGIVPLGSRTLIQTEEGLTALPLLNRPEARSLLVVGFGGGTALETIPSFVERIDVIDLEPEVIAANRSIGARRARDPLSDPRLRVHLGDARGALVLTDQRWDVIVSQPSHPWTAGASHLYTREFFAQVRDHLSPGGAFLQWIGRPFVDEALLRSLVATLLEVFPHVQLYEPSNSGQVLFLASDAPLDGTDAAARAIARDPVAFASAGYRAPEDLVAALWLDEPAARRFAEGGEITTDDQNLLQTRSPRLLQRETPAKATDGLIAALDTLPERASRLPDADGLYVVRRLLSTREVARAQRVAERLPDPDLRVAGRALMTLATHLENEDDDGPPRPSAQDDARHARASEQLASVIAKRPEWIEARWALLRERKSAWLAGDPAAVALAEPIGDGARAVLDGWRLEAAGEVSGLRALERRLAMVSLRHPAAGEATRLRARWRAASGDPALAGEAIALLDQFMSPVIAPELLLARVQACLAAGHVVAAEDALAKLSTRIGGADDPRGVAEAARELLRRLPDGTGSAERRKNVAKRLDAYLAVRAAASSAGG